jgi:hypothetical protein
MRGLRSGHTFGDGPRGLRRVLLRIQSVEQEPIESPHTQVHLRAVMAWR